MKQTKPSGVRQEIEKIITYHSELGEGTSGYLLSNDQIDALEALYKSRLQAEVEGIIGETKDLHEKGCKTYVTDSWDNGWHEALFAVEELLVSRLTKQPLKRGKQEG